MDTPRPASRFGPALIIVLLIVAAILITLAVATYAEAQTPDPPVLPQKVVNVTFAPPSTVVAVPAGANLQTAINNAAPGTTLLLTAGATYAPISLPNKGASTDWIYILSNAATLPVPGNRVFPMDAPKMAKITCVNVVCVGTQAGAHHYRFVGIEFAQTGNLQNSAVNLWLDGGDPHHIIVDRSYIHGTAANTLRRGVTLNGADLAVVDSYISDVHEQGADSQAVWNKSGTGPLLIQNNYLSAAGENFMCGGDDPPSGTIGTSDITLRGNYLFKPTAWKTSGFVVKNLIELKNCRRVLVEGNVSEHNWAGGQAGYGWLLTPRNQSGSCPGCGLQDITWRLNILKDSPQGINILGEDDNNISTRTDRVLLENNRLEVCCTSGSDGAAIQIGHGPRNLAATHNTWPTDGTMMSLYSNAPQGFNFAFLNNIIPNGSYGVHTQDCNQSITQCLASQFNPVRFTANAVLGGDVNGGWPTGNFFPATISGATQTGTDGKPIGADPTLLTAATACTVSGQCSGVTPPPVDTTAPTVTWQSPAAGQSVVQGTIVTLLATATDSQSSVGPVSYTANGVPVTSPYTASTVGTISFVAFATDTANNTGQASQSLIVTAPSPQNPVNCVQGAWVVQSLQQSAGGNFTIILSRPTITPAQFGGTACGISTWTTSVIF